MWGRFKSGFFLICLPLLPLLARVAVEVYTQAPSAKNRNHVTAEVSAATESYRRELLMALDLYVRAERVLRSEQLSYVSYLGRTPDVFGALVHSYKIEVARATRHKLLVIATAEVGKTLISKTDGGISGDLARTAGDRISIDEAFRVNANFPLPAPEREYLHVVARSVLAKISANQFIIPDRTELNVLEGVFKNYFSYEIRPVSQGGRTLVAVGLTEPVKGDVVEMGPASNIFEWVFNHRSTSWVEQELHGRLQEIYWAERIFQEHTGSYASSLKDLLPEWEHLGVLASKFSPLSVELLQVDPTFGFHAEVAPVAVNGRAPSSSRAWTINGYGQVSEVAGDERVIDVFEQARKKIASLGNDASQGIEGSEGIERIEDVRSDRGEHLRKAPLKEIADSEPQHRLTQDLTNTTGGAEANSDDDRGRKPLLIDAVDGP